jgi:uncharacterized protein YutE (UPF0331/DUF86 family)
LLERIEQLEENIVMLKKLHENYSLEDIKANRLDEWALRYGLFESIQIIIDITCHISSKYNLGTTKTYTSCVKNLVNHKFINEKLAKNLVSAIGLRNILIHEYVKIDTEQLYSFLSLTEDFSDFIGEVHDVL